jgi:predicted DNA-binding transcriptional regulator YafY
LVRASRLLQLLMTLQARGRVSAAALAEELGVSVRTVYRDVDELSLSGVPVVAERGAGGGFELLGGFRTRLTGLTSGEARSLPLLGLPGPAGQLGLGEEVASAQLKLLAALPEGWQGDADRVGSTFHVDPVGWYRTPKPPDQLRAVAAAVWAGERLELRYQSWKATRPRTVEPLGLVLKAGDWYLLAGSPGRREPAVYKVANVREARRTGQRFQRPRRFDLARAWAAHVARFEASLLQQRARLRLSPRAVERLERERSALGRAVREAARRPLARGWIELEVPFESVAFTGPDLLRLGGEAEALEPAELRDWLVAQVRGLAERYLPARRGR